MANAITDTAQLTCNQGATPSNLLVTSQDFVTIEDKPIATEADKQPNVNIFGQCRLKPSSSGYLPCVPAPQKWEKTAEKNTINDDAILTENSFCMCSVGGKISVKDKGHSEIHIFEDEPVNNYVQNNEQSSGTEKKDTVEEEKRPEVIDGYWINSKGEKINFRPFEETKIRFQFEVNQKAIGNYITFEVMDMNITNAYESIVYSKIIELKYNLNQVEVNINKIFEKALNIDRKIKHKLLLYVQLKINKTKVFPKKIKDYLKIFVVEFVPIAMKNQKPSWIVATKLQKEWFSRSKAQKPYYSKPVTNIATMSWIKSFTYVTRY